MPRWRWFRHARVALAKIGAAGGGPRAARRPFLTSRMILTESWGLANRQVARRLRSSDLRVAGVPERRWDGPRWAPSLDRLVTLREEPYGL